MITLYGIKNCDTIKKAKLFLAEHQLDYRFHDYRADGLSVELLNDFVAKLGWQQLLNTRGTTWRQLSEELKANLDQDRAISLMLSQPALIKRPILVRDAEYLLGFSENNYQTLITNL